MAEAQEILIGVRATLEHGKKQLSILAGHLAERASLVVVSSLYQIAITDGGWRADENNRDGLAVCFHIQSNDEAAELLTWIEEEEKALGKDAVRKKIAIYLLAYGQKVAMSRALHLPHPSLHSDPTLLGPAKEVLPGYRHPILRKTLSELAAEFVEERWGKFYAQGQLLLNDGSQSR